MKSLNNFIVKTLVCSSFLSGFINVSNAADIDAKDVKLSSGWDVETVFDQTFTQINDLYNNDTKIKTNVSALQSSNLFRDDAIKLAESKASAALSGVATNGSDIINMQKDQRAQDQIISGVDTEAKQAGVLADTANNKADTALKGVLQNGSDIINLQKDQRDQNQIISGVDVEAKQAGVLADTANHKANASLEGVVQNGSDIITLKTKTDKVESDALLANVKADDAKKTAVAAQGKADFVDVKADQALTAANTAKTSAANANTKADANTQLMSHNAVNISKNQKAVSSKVENTTFKADQDRQDKAVETVQTQVKSHTAQLTQHESRITQLENQNNARFSSVEHQQNEDRKEYRAGIAGVGAIAGLHYVDTDNAVAVGAANFKDAQGYAMGYRHKFSENVAATMSASGTSNGDEIVAASASFGW